MHFCIENISHDFSDEAVVRTQSYSNSLCLTLTIIKRNRIPKKTEGSCIHRLRADNCPFALGWLKPHFLQCVPNLGREPLGSGFQIFLFLLHNYGSLNTFFSSAAHLSSLILSMQLQILLIVSCIYSHNNKEMTL